MLNPKGFRIYSSKQPAPTICSYGSEKYCGPGRNGQFITDKVGIGTFRATEAARIHNFIPRVVDQGGALPDSVLLSPLGPTGFCQLGSTRFRLQNPVMFVSVNSVQLGSTRFNSVGLRATQENRVLCVNPVLAA